MGKAMVDVGLGMERSWGGSWSRGLRLRWEEAGMRSQGGWRQEWQWMGEMAGKIEWAWVQVAGVGLAEYQKRGAPRGGLKGGVGGPGGGGGWHRGRIRRSGR
jgi:hypothetical protein